MSLPEGREGSGHSQSVDNSVTDENLTNEDPNSPSNISANNSHLLSLLHPNVVTVYGSNNNATTLGTKSLYYSPKTLEELLNLSTSLQATGSQEETNSMTGDQENMMDVEKRKFLIQALEELSVDVVTEMRRNIKTLAEVKTKSDEDLEKYELILEGINDQVCCIDMANVFYQLGGLEVAVELLNSSKASIRWKAASIIAECCQNNPYSQRLSVLDYVFCPLMEMAKSDPDMNVKYKTLSAISAIVRDNPSGIKQFRRYNGFDLLQDALGSANEKIISKASFLVMALCDTDDSTKDDLVQAGIVETLISLARFTDNLHSEYFLRALVSLIHNHDAATAECLKIAEEEGPVGFWYFLGKTISQKSNDEACKELVECAREIQKLMNEFVDGPVIEERLQ